MVRVESLNRPSAGWKELERRGCGSHANITSHNRPISPVKTINYNIEKEKRETKEERWGKSGVKRKSSDAEKDRSRDQGIT